MTPQEERAKKLADAHWAYTGGLLRLTGGDMALSEYLYKAAATHFYGHAWEDFRNGMFGPSAAELEPVPQPPLSDLYLHGNLCPSCQRNGTVKCAGNYQVTADGGCKGYIKADKESLCLSCGDTDCTGKLQPLPPMENCSFHNAGEAVAERKASLCHSCHVETCSKEYVTACEVYGACDRYTPALRERMLDAKEEAIATAKQDAPKTDEPATAHTDPATVTPVTLEMCPSCDHHPGCKGQYPPTEDGRCRGFSAKAALDFTLPPIALECSRAEILGKFHEEMKELRGTPHGSMAELIEAWDCIQVAQTYREHGGCADEVDASGVADSLREWHSQGRPVMQAKRAMKIKNASRDMYSAEDNTAILATV